MISLRCPTLILGGGLSAAHRRCRGDRSEKGQAVEQSYSTACHILKIYL
jgi:hypothetical protein